MTQKLQAINVIKNLNTDELVKCLNNNGYGELEDIIIEKNLDGEKLLNLSEFQIGIWRLNKNVTKRLKECVDVLQRDPEKFIGRQTEKYNRRQSFISDHSSQNNATRKKLEQFLTMPSQKKPSIPPRNFPPVCNTDNGNNEYLCMERPQSETEIPDYDEQGYLNPSALNNENDNDYEPSPVVTKDSPKSRHQQEFINEPEEQYKNVPNSIRPKLPPRITISSARFGTRTLSNNNENKFNRNTDRDDIPPPIPKRDGTNDTTVLTRRIFKSSEESVQKSTPLSNPILSWIKEKQPSIKRNRTNHTDDKFKTEDMKENETNEDNEEENIYEQEPLPSSPQNQRQNASDWSSTKPTFSNGFLNRPLPQIPLPKEESPRIISKNDDKLYQNNNEERELTKETTFTTKRARSPRTTSTLKDSKNPIILTNNGDNIQQKNHDLALELARKIKIKQSSVFSNQPLRVTKTFKGSEESIPSDNDEDSLYKNDSVALEVMKKRLEQHRLHGGFNDSTAKLRTENTDPPSSMRNKNTSPNKVVSTTSSNESLVSKKSQRISTSSEAEPEVRYENFETRSNRSEECDFDSIKSSSLSNISFNPIALLPVRPFSRNFQSSSRGQSDNETEDDQDYAEAFSNLNNEPYYRHTDRRGAKQLLHGLENGAFLFRPSKTSFLALTIKWDDKFYNINIEKNSNLIQCHTVPGSISPGFSSLETFIKHFEKNPLLLKHKDDICEVYLKCVLPSKRF